MLRVWKESYTRPRPMKSAAAFSTAAHVAIVALWVVATLPAASMAVDSIANHIYYIPPPDREPLVAGATETVRYVNIANGLAFGPGPAALDARLPARPSRVTAEAGPRTDTTVVITPGNNPTQTDSVFTVLEVDSAVARSENSAAPAYPLELLKQHIEGSVRVRYVVDTTGFADPTSILVLEATHPAFAESVREVLHYMRFSPAKIGTKKVRQLVEQPFTFHIAARAEAGVKPLAERTRHP